MFSSPLVVQHPLAQIHLTEIRRQDTTSSLFRWHLHRLAEILFIEATRDLEVSSTRVLTPLKETDGVAFKRPMVLTPILRAGLGLQEAILQMVPDAVVAHIGIARDECTAQPMPYYAKLPEILKDADVFLLDPMLATGGSACSAATQLKAAGATRITLLCVVSCPQGLAAFSLQHPDIRVVTSTVDEGLDHRCFIVPGLGDAGDRCFGT
jgi:uracil phosphoribosyltransferase